MQLWLTKSQQSFTPWRTLGYLDSYLLSLLFNIFVALWDSNSVQIELCPSLWLSQFYSSGQHCVLVNLVPSRPPYVEGSSRILLTPILKTHQFQREVLKWADGPPSRTLASPLMHKYQIWADEICLKLSIAINFWKWRSYC